MVGDGSYLMLNSEIATSVMLGTKLIVVVLDNRGFGCINRLQQACGGAPFNNLLDDCVPGRRRRAGDRLRGARALARRAGRARRDDRRARGGARSARAPPTARYVICIDTDPRAPPRRRLVVGSRACRKCRQRARCATRAEYEHAQRPDR